MKKLILGIILAFCFVAPVVSQGQIVVEVGHRHHHHHHHYHPRQ